MADNARAKIQRVLKIIQGKIKKGETGLLYTAIDELLPSDYDKKTLFERFQIRENDYYQTSRAKEIISDALSLIGLHFSQKSDKELSKIREKLSNEYDEKMALLPKMIGLLLSDLNYVSHNNINYMFKQFRIANNKSTMDDGGSIISFKKIYRLDLNNEFVSLERDNFGYRVFIFIGVAVISNLLKYPKKFPQAKEDRIDDSPKTAAETEAIPHPESVHIVMMLVVPADKLNDINEGDIIASDTAVRLIDNAVYFGCFPQEKASDIETELELQDEAFSRDTAQDIFISLEQKNGQEMIKKSSMKFSLKKYLQNNPREFTISKIRRLKKRYGVIKLKRI